jgi:DNA-binding MarR family transcriptional regulator
MPKTPATPDAVAAIARAVLQLGRRLRAARPANSVSLSTLGVLSTLHRHGAMTATELALAERLKPQSLTRLLAEMEASRLIRRSRDPKDGRAQIIEITQRGRGAFAQDMAARREWLRAAMARTLSAEESRLLTKSAELMLRLALDEGAALPQRRRRDLR